MPIIRADEMYATAFAECSENIKQFLELLNRKTPDIDWARLEYDGCVQPDGSLFRVLETLRTAEEQIAYFLMGRKGVEYNQNILSTPNPFCSQTPAIQYELISCGTIENEDELATYAWAGQSYHNWGLAIDLILIKFGDPLYLVYLSLPQPAALNGAEPGQASRIFRIFRIQSTKFLRRHIITTKT